MKNKAFKKNKDNVLIEVGKVIKHWNEMDENKKINTLVAVKTKTQIDYGNKKKWKKTIIVSRGTLNAKTKYWTLGGE